jgi:hypothetical protein
MLPGTAWFHTSGIDVAAIMMNVKGIAVGSAYLSHLPLTRESIWMQSLWLRLIRGSRQSEF